MTPETTIIRSLLEERRRVADADRLARASRCCTASSPCCTALSLRDRLARLAR